MGSMHSSPTTATHSGSTAAQPRRAPARTPHHPISDMDDATLRLIVAVELEEARSLSDDSNGTSDCAMARRFTIDQLLSCRTLNRIEEMTDAELTRTALPPPTAADTCTSCEDQLKVTKSWQAPCKHWYCSDCLETLIRACLNDETLYPPRCCVVMPWREIKGLLPKELVASFEKKRAEFDTLAIERLYCAQPAYSHFLGSTTTPARSVICSLCDRSLCDSNTCTTCKAASHAGSCLAEPNEAEQQTLQLANEQGWQSCQRCKQIVDLIPGGCNHMTCRCGHQFCYACGQRWKTCRCAVLDIGNAGHGVHPDVLAARDRYMEALGVIEGHLRQLREAQRVLVQRLGDFLQIMEARRAE